MELHSKALGLVAAAAALVVSGVMAPREAAAQVRVNGLAGMQHLGVNGPQTTGGTTGTLRVEGALSLFPWIEAGAYGEVLSDFSGGSSGTDFGGIVAVRPHIPTSSVDPLVFASVGYLKYPIGNSALTGGWEGQLGAGLTFHVNPWVDVEGRVALVEMLSQDSSVLDTHGFAASAGISLHP